MKTLNFVLFAVTIAAAQISGIKTGLEVWQMTENARKASAPRWPASENMYLKAIK